MADTARDLGISTESIYTWRRQDRIDRGLAPGLTSTEKAELTAAKRRTAEQEAELAMHRRGQNATCKASTTSSEHTRPANDQPTTLRANTPNTATQDTPTPQ